MQRGWLAFALLGACYQEPHIGEGGPIDGSPMSEPQPDMPPNCFGTGLDVQNVCLTDAPAAAIDLSNTKNYDTGGPDCDHGIAKWCVVAATSIHIEATGLVGAHGMRPLVLISTSTIVIDGAIDVASHIDNPMQQLGPGADASACHSGTGPTGNGGGWGGSFATKGGDGGGTNGGLAGMTLTPMILQGGCNGADGGNNGGQRGHGGGAVYLIGTSITVNGVINASGESGAGAVAADRGGGGAGSGGLIVFDTPQLVVAGGALIFANGGGGGEGSGGFLGFPGADSTAPTVAGAGGTGGTTGGDGGNGGIATSGGGTGAAATVGGEGSGGGGGGVGVIKVFRATPPTTGMVSPPFS